MFFIFAESEGGEYIWSKILIEGHLSDGGLDENKRGAGVQRKYIRRIFN
jgi:hypothetical protein